MLAIFLSPAGMSLTKLSLAGNTFLQCRLWNGANSNDSKNASFVTYPCSIGKNIPQVFWNWLRYLPAMPISTDLLQTFMHYFISQWKILSRVATNFTESLWRRQEFKFSQNPWRYFENVFKKAICLTIIRKIAMNTYTRKDYVKRKQPRNIGLSSADGLGRDKDNASQSYNF